MPPDTETRTQSGVTSREGQHHFPKFLESLCHALYVRHYSNRTTDTYGTWTRRFVRFHSLRHPKEMGEAEINAFLTHLTAEKKVSSSTYHNDLLYPCVELQADWSPESQLTGCEPCSYADPYKKQKYIAKRRLTYIIE